MGAGSIEGLICRGTLRRFFLTEIFPRSVPDRGTLFSNHVMARGYRTGPRYAPAGSSGRNIVAAGRITQLRAVREHVLRHNCGSHDPGVTVLAATACIFQTRDHGDPTGRMPDQG